MSSTILLPPRAQLCNRSCSNKHTLFRVLRWPGRSGSRAETHAGARRLVGVRRGWEILLQAARAEVRTWPRASATIIFARGQVCVCVVLWCVCVCALSTPSPTTPFGRIKHTSCARVFIQSCWAQEGACANEEEEEEGYVFTTLHLSLYNKSADR